MMLAFVDIESDTTLVTASIHDVLPPVGGVAAPSICFEFPAHQSNVPGVISHRMSRCVRHRHMRIMLDGHDVGMMVGHISVPAANMLTPVQILGSSRKVVLAASDIKIDGSPVAACGVMMACGDPVGLPMAMSVTCVTNSVIFSFSFTDAMRAMVRVVGQMFFEMVLRYLSPNKASVAGGLESELRRSLVFQMLFGASSGVDIAKKVYKEVMAVGSGAVFDKYASDSGEASIHATYATPFADVSWRGSSGSRRPGGDRDGVPVVERMDGLLVDDRADIGSVVGDERGGSSRTVRGEVASRRSDDAVYWGTVDDSRARVDDDVARIRRDPLSALYYFGRGE